MRFGEGKKEDAIALMSKAADLEDLTEKHPVSPGAIVPARELLGDMYMKLGDAPHALAAYESALERQPKRFNGLNGAAEAAAKAGDKDKAKRYYDEMISVAQLSERPELAKAIAYVGQR